MAMRKLLLCAGLLLSNRAAHALLLGGTEVPKDKVIVYLLIGHSNMAGIDIRLSDPVTHPRTWNYQWFSDKKWVAAKESPGNIKNGLSSRGEGGPGMPFLKGMAAAYPQYYFGVISNASVSCTLRGVNLGSNSSDLDAENNRYWKGATLYAEIIDAALAVQKDVTLGGIICMLGTVESTRTSAAVCQSFSNDAARMAADMRQDLNLPNLPFIIGEYEAGSTGDFAVTKAWPAIVDQEIKAIPGKLAFSATVDSRNIAMRDNHHYSTDVGQPEFARRLVAVIQAKGWGPGLTTHIFAGKQADREMISGPSPSTGYYWADGKKLSPLSRHAAGTAFPGPGLPLRRADGSVPLFPQPP